MLLRLSTINHLSQEEIKGGKTHVQCNKCNKDIREIEEHYQCNNEHQEYFHRDCKDKRKKYIKFDEAFELVKILWDHEHIKEIGLKIKELFIPRTELLFMIVSPKFDEKRKLTQEEL